MICKWVVSENDSDVGSRRIRDIWDSRGGNNLAPMGKTKFCQMGQNYPRKPYDHPINFHNGNKFLEYSKSGIRS